jgi:hypothetical protein
VRLSQGPLNEKDPITVDSEARLATAVVHTCKSVTRPLFPWLEENFADTRYTGEKLRSVLVGQAALLLEIINRPRETAGPVLLSRRRVVEGTVAWFGISRGLHKNYAHPRMPIHRQYAFS